MKIINAADVGARLSWQQAVEALRDGHRQPKPLADDMLLAPGENRLLVRSAWIEGLGGGLKAVTIFPGNPSASPPLPAVQGQFLLFGEGDGDVVAVIEGAALTAWKTAADSALGADLLARTSSDVLTMIGAGAMAEPLVRAHKSVRPGLSKVMLWNRNLEKCRFLKSTLADLGVEIGIAESLEAAVRSADIICTATMACEPLIHGDWLRPGTHVDLVGAYTPTMREADDVALTRGRLFADFAPSALETGELAIPLSQRVIMPSDLVGDLYGLVAGTCGRETEKEISLYKNGGGAHLDLMMACAVVSG